MTNRPSHLKGKQIGYYYRGKYSAKNKAAQTKKKKPNPYRQRWISPERGDSLQTRADAVRIWCDGSASYRDRSGGWGAVLIFPEDGRVEEIEGAASGTTSQRMEMTAALKALESLSEGAHAAVYSDSAYLVNCFQNYWISTWARRDWKTSAGTPVMNQDLWEALVGAVERLCSAGGSVEWIKVSGHSGEPYNERADVLACAARAKGIAEARDR